MIFADKLIELRKKNGISQEELAEKMQVSRQSVSKWEGAQSVPDLNKILKLSEIFGVSTDYLLKDEIEISDSETGISLEKSESETLRPVSLEEAGKFLEINQQCAVLKAVSVMLFILAPAMYFLLTDISEILAAVILLVLIAVGVMLQILSGQKLKPYDYLSESAIDTAYGVSGMVKERQTAYAVRHTIEIIIGIMLCILSVIPVLISGNDYCIALTLGIIAAGVGLLVKTGKFSSGFQKLLEEERYSRKEKENYQKKADIAGIYWLTVTAVYLALSFISGHWEFTWIIWPVAGVFFGVIAIITKHSYK